MSKVKKYCVIMTGGDEGTGRLDIMARFIEGKSNSDGFVLDSNETFESKTKEMKVEGSPVHLTVIDTASQEKFRIVTSSVYRRAHACIVVYDIGDRESFENVNNWLKDIRLYAKSKIVTAVVGNGSNLSPDKRLVSAQTAKDFCNNNRVEIFREVSAETGDGVNQLFEDLVRVIHERIGNEGGSTSATGERTDTIELVPNDTTSKPKEKKQFCEI